VTGAETPHGPAKALLAHALDGPEAARLSAEELAVLVDAVAGSERERALLLAALRRSQNPGLPLQVADMLEQAGIRLATLEAAKSAVDEVVGVWAQRSVAAGAAVVAGAALAGSVGAAAVALVGGALLAAGVGVTMGRLALRRRRAALAERRDLIRSLAASVRESRGN
jgi:hypothetical protein